MIESDWKKMIEITEEEEMDKLEVHDYFLYGTNMIAQKQNKKIGQEISYFVVMNKNGRHIEYGPVFDMLEKDLIKGD
jgi:hypothetical protein